MSMSALQITTTVDDLAEQHCLATKDVSIAVNLAYGHESPGSQADPGIHDAQTLNVEDLLVKLIQHVAAQSRKEKEDHNGG